MVEAFSHLAEIFEFRLAEFCLRLEAPLNKKLSGRGRGGDGCRNFSRMFQKAYTPAETFCGRRKCFAGLQGLFADGAKGMHACGNIFRKAKCCSTFPGEQGTGVIDVLFGTGMLKEDVPRRYSRKKRGSVRRSRNSLGRIVGYSEKGGVCFRYRDYRAECRKKPAYDRFSRSSGGWKTTWVVPNPLGWRAGSF